MNLFFPVWQVKLIGVHFPTRPMLHVLLGFLSPFKLSKPKIHIVLPCRSLNNSDWLLSLCLLCQNITFIQTPPPTRVNIATSTLEANGLLALSKPTKRPLPLTISTVNSRFRRHNEASGHKLSAMSSLFYPHKTERARERDPFLFLLLFQEPSRAHQRN